MTETKTCREAVMAIWTSEGWIDQSKFQGCRTVSTESDGRYTAHLRAFLEASDLDAEAQWVVLADGSLVATQSIDHPGCAKCGTEDTGRFTDGDDVCLDCRSTQPDEKSSCCDASIVWAAELVPFMEWQLVCEDCQATLFEPCGDCERLVHYDYSTERYVHRDEPTVGCFLHAGVAPPKSEHAASHTWDGERCSVCGVGLHGTASIMVCAPDRTAKGLAKVNEGQR